MPYITCNVYMYCRGDGASRVVLVFDQRTCMIHFVSPPPPPSPSPQVMPPFLSVIRTCDKNMREYLFNQLGEIVSIIKQHARNYMSEVFAVIKVPVYAYACSYMCTCMLIVIVSVCSHTIVLHVPVVLCVRSRAVVILSSVYLSLHPGFPCIHCQCMLHNTVGSNSATPMNVYCILPAHH